LYGFVLWCKISAFSAELQIIGDFYLIFAWWRIVLFGKRRKLQEENGGAVSEYYSDAMDNDFGGAGVCI
jgi:hypothetical protein